MYTGARLHYGRHTFRSHFGSRFFAQAILAQAWLSLLPMATVPIASSNGFKKFLGDESFHREAAATNASGVNCEYMNFFGDDGFHREAAATNASGEKCEHNSLSSTA